MTLVKGPNGLIVDVAPSIASGLIGGGHVVAVGAEGEDSEATSEDTTQDNAEVEDTEDDSDESPTPDPAKPGGNASKQVWYDYALAQGFAEEQLDGLKQSDIRALFNE